MKGQQLDKEQCYKALAARVGVGNRHLRRLFHEHVGTSPLNVTRAHRLLFAKKLLTETRLPAADVAFAVGFGSVRRFNTAIRDAYDKTPREVRGARDHRIRLKLPYKPPYDWPAMLDYLRARAIEGIEEVEAETYRRSFDVGVLEVHHGGNGHLVASIEISEVSRVAAVIARTRDRVSGGEGRLRSRFTLAGRRSRREHPTVEKPAGYW